MKDKLLQPNWFDGPAIPVNLFKDNENDEDEPGEEHRGTGDGSSDEEEPSEMETADDEPWSEDSDDSDSSYD